MRNAKVVVKSGGHTETFPNVRLPLQLGRQQHDEPDWLKLKSLGSEYRIAITPLKDIRVPREFVRIEEDAGRLTFRNTHSRFVFAIQPDAASVQPDQQIMVGSVATIAIADDVEVTIELAYEEGFFDMDQSLRTLEGSQHFFDDENCEEGNLADLLEDNQSGETRLQVVVSLVRQVLQVVQKAAGSDEYFQAAVETAANMIQLDRTFVLLYHEGVWRVRVEYNSKTNRSIVSTESRGFESMPRGSGLLRERVLITKKTVIYEPNACTYATGSSMMALDRAVAAPMLDESGEVIGVLYGDRHFESERGEQPIGELEATLLEVIAGAVATGLARQREEALRASMTQFFSPSVTERLERDDNLLLGKDAEVSVFFCDIRGFSSIAEREGPGRTIEWINDVLTELSQCVLDNDGVLVDYVGDELMAMWGAPAEQSDHALRACRTAIQMLDRIEPLRKRWHKITPNRFGFGIGINTGVARVGNTGSKLKFKYGPLGNVVNVASRLQGMSKRFGVPIIVSGSTAKAIANQVDSSVNHPFSTRRLADVVPLGVHEVISVYELAKGDDETWASIRSLYEQALAHFHDNDLTGAARELATLVHEHPSDTPSVQLLGRVVDALTKGLDTIDPVIRFDSK